MHWYDAYAKIRPYVVRISTIDGFGTGFLFAYNKTRSLAAVATASHVIERAVDWRQPLKIWHPASKTTSHLEEKDRAAWLDAKHDAATMLIPAARIDFPKEVLPLVPQDKVKRIGVEVGWVGFPHLAPNNICFFSGAISANVGLDDSYLIDGVAINGVSGGPVFDDVTQLVGVVSAYMANRRPGESLPGLLQAQDLTAFHDSIQKIKSLDEAKEQEKKGAEEKQAEASKQSPPGSTPPPKGG